MTNVFSYRTAFACRTFAAIALILVASVSSADAASDRNSVLNTVSNQQSVVFAAGSTEAVGFPAGTQDVNISAHGWQRYVDSIASDKLLLPFASSYELSQFISSNAAQTGFVFDFIRPASSVPVDFSAGVSNASHIEGGQTVNENVVVPQARLDTRSDTAFNAARKVELATKSLTMKRNDCRAPIDYNTGQPVPGPQNICSEKSWVETPQLILTFKPTIGYTAGSVEDPVRTITQAAADDYAGRITNHQWLISWGAPLGAVPPVSYPPVGEPCPPTAHNSHTWLALSNGNSQLVTGGAASAAPNSCTNGVQSAVRRWDTQQDAICYDSIFYRQPATREVNVSWSNVTCNPDVTCGAGSAKSPAGDKCMSIADTNVDANTFTNGTFWPSWLTPRGEGGENSYRINEMADSARYTCAARGKMYMHDFAGWGRGKRKSHSDTDFAAAVFNGDRNNPANYLSLGSYSSVGLKNKDSEDWGYMSHALCSGPNYLVPTVNTIVVNTPNANAATPPAGMPACPGDLNLMGNPFSNTTYFASTRYSMPGFNGSTVGAQQARTAYETLQTWAGVHANPYRPALAKQELNCYQRTDVASPRYNYDAPADQWTTSEQCYDLGYWGYYCDTVSTPPISGYDHTYSLYTLTTQLHCTQQTVTEPTGRTVENCNNTGRQGSEYRTYTASQGNVCGNDSAQTLSCVPTPDPEEDICVTRPHLCYGGGGGGGGYENMYLY